LTDQPEFLTITQLIEDLQAVKHDYGDLKIVLSCDGEGNRFSPMSQGVSVGLYDGGEFYGDLLELPSDEDLASEDGDDFKFYAQLKADYESAKQRGCPGVLSLWPVG
jgi:hypothetical protein